MTDENDVTTDVEGLIIKRVKGYCEEMSLSFRKIEDQKALQKAALEALCEEFESLDKKILKKMAKTFHAQNFTAVVHTDEAFQTEYTKVFGVPEDV